MRQEIDGQIWDSWGCDDILRGEVLNLPWYHFYDVVEVVAQRLISRQPDEPFGGAADKFSLEAYRTQVNELFEEDAILWRLDERGHLSRARPLALEQRMKDAESALTDGFEPARDHYRKAVRYLYEHPLDPENAVKEIVSCVESASRVLYPKANTLGEAVKQMRGEGILPQGLITTMEKYYAFASSEPAVRHGSPAASRLGLSEAELALHFGIAIVRYLVAHHTKDRG